MLLLNKPEGMTPSEAIRALKRQRPSLTKETISYAGRLDPMAQGLLLLLVGDENKNRHAYEAYEKTYYFEVLLGVATDTYDILGLITNQAITNLSSLQVLPNPILDQVIKQLKGTQQQAYPPYSSKPVQGKPLYWWAREGKLREILIPEKTISITSLSVLKIRSVSPPLLQQTILERISRVQGDFRQDEIRSSWRSFFTSPPLHSYPILTLQVSCSSGTYVRSIAHRIGDMLGCHALAYSITRTTIGESQLQDAIQIDAIG